MQRVVWGAVTALVLVQGRAAAQQQQDPKLASAAAQACLQGKGYSVQ